MDFRHKSASAKSRNRFQHLHFGKLSPGTRNYSQDPFREKQDSRFLPDNEDNGLCSRKGCFQACPEGLLHSGGQRTTYKARTYTKKATANVSPHSAPL